MNFALALCLFAQTPVVEENFDEAVVVTHTFTRKAGTFTVTSLHLNRGGLRYLADANVEADEYHWKSETGGLTVRYYDTLAECGRVIHVKKLREVVLDHELTGVVWQRMKPPQ